MRVTTRSEVKSAIQHAQQSEGTVLIDFRVEQEDSVYPMVPAGGDLHNMIRRPVQNVLVESARD
jgi:acetolactate synthase I/II/III large subunit